jgi:hypothetical protein
LRLRRAPEGRFCRAAAPVIVDLTEPAVLAFLNGDTVIHWAQKTLGL